MFFDKKRKWDKPVTKLELYKILGSLYKHIPYKVIQEMLLLDYLHFSPHSTSFYNKKKDWNVTIDETIRWSDHWNFTCPKRTGDKIHSKSDMQIYQNTWARGKYNKDLDIFIIEEVYENIFATKEELVEIKNSIKPEATSLKVKYSEEAIEKRKEFSKKVKDGEIKCHFNGNSFVIKKYNKSKIDLIDNITLTKKIDENTAHEFFTNMYPDFCLIIDDKKYTEQMLIKEMLY